MDKHEEKSNTEDSPLAVERVQIGVRMEKRMVKVLKGLAEYHDMSLGDLLEGIVLHAFENTPPFSEESLQRIAQLKDVYGMDYGASASHKFTESDMGKENM
ncbi:MAG TPA: hypothetical protein VF043_04465 [Ktedonobacteraceae bacterium]